jgi:prepilin-type N-terminal cleavage/methylation domain-containing protein
MMNSSLKHSSSSLRGGFTLLEVMVSLLIGALLVGGLMGLISVSLQYSQRLKEKTQIQPLLEAAAEQILANPQKAMAGSFTLGTEANAPRINIELARQELAEFKGKGTRAGELYRVLLECRGQLLEFSLHVIPSNEEQPGEEFSS